jgi:hypothetical protein
MRAGLVDLEDKLAHVSHLVEALHMASGDLGDKAVVNALQAVIVTVQDRLEEAQVQVESMRAKGCM